LTFQPGFFNENCNSPFRVFARLISIRFVAFFFKVTENTKPPPADQMVLGAGSKNLIYSARNPTPILPAQCLRIFGQKVAKSSKKTKRKIFY
jgi:hypothetical protein